MDKPYMLRIINGTRYRCYDIGCPDFEQAARNRKMVEDRENIAGYIKAEIAITKTPLDQPLAVWIPTGELPTIAKEIWHELSGVHVEDFDEEAIKVVDAVLTKHLGEGV